MQHSLHPVARLLQVAVLATLGLLPQLHAKDFKLIDQLPERLQKAKAIAQKGWDSGVTPKMKAASAQYNEVITAMITELISTYYPKDSISQEDIQTYLKALFTAQHFKQNAANPSGEPLGTNAGVEILGNITAELESTVSDMVQAIVADDTTFDFDAWKQRWDKVEE